MPVWNIFDHPDGPPEDAHALPIPHTSLPRSLRPPASPAHAAGVLALPPTPQNAIRDALRSLGGPVQENPPWILGPCIRPGDCAYFVGEGGAGESTLVADLLMAALDPARGAALAGSWRVNRALLPAEPRALVINAETSLENDWRVHLMRANAAQGHTPNGPLDTALRERVDFLDKDDLEITPLNLHAAMTELAAVIVAEGYSFVVIDPVYALFSPEDPSQDAWVTVGMKTLMTTLKSHAITTFALAHPPETASTSLKARFKPYGSSQQKGQMDAHFGLKRAGNTAVELVKLKDRRAGWIPPLAARLRLQFQPVGGGYTQFAPAGSEWEYDNPREFVLSDSASEYLARLPYPDDFRAANVELAGLRRATFLAHCESYYIPQGILTETTLETERGRPKLYAWTERGHRAHAQAAKG